MGTACTLSVTALPTDALRARRALAAGRAEVEACERVLSRFDQASDLSRMNRRAGEWVEVDARLAVALRIAVRARATTGGKFDPTILPALVAAGYDRTFEELEERPARVHHGWRAAARSRSTSTRASFGSSQERWWTSEGSGRASPRPGLSSRCGTRGRAPWGARRPGGDVAVQGRPPEGGPWRIAVADPRSPEVAVGILGVDDGAVATSGRTARRFGPGRTLHHLIDPHTGAPAVAGPLSVTVVAQDAAWAEAHATALAISDPVEARAYVAAHPGVSALLVSDDGDSSRWDRFGSRPRRSRPFDERLPRTGADRLVRRACVGLVAFAALTLSVWLGLATSTRLLGPKRMKSLVGWHQTIAWTGVSMLGLHVGALLFDPTLHFGLAALLVPFAAPWSPAAVAAGVVAGWTMLAIASSFRLRKWIGQKGWRRLHYLSFGAFVLALGHALVAGTDLHGWAARSSPRSPLAL